MAEPVRRWGGRRRLARLPVIIPARCRTLSGLLARGVVADISAEGCRFESESVMLRAGQTVVITPQGLQGLRGTVLWADRRVAGIAFNQRLYEPVVDDLARRHASGYPLPR